MDAIWPFMLITKTKIHCFWDYIFLLPASERDDLRESGNKIININYGSIISDFPVIVFVTSLPFLILLLQIMSNRDHVLSAIQW